MSERLPLSRRIAADLRAAIMQGELAPGAVLPSERQLIARAAGHGLALQGLGSYRAEGSDDDRAGLVVGYGRPAEHAYTTALARLCAVLDRQVTGRAGAAAAATARPGTG